MDPLIWLMERPHGIAPLFECHTPMAVATKTVGSRTVLRRHVDMERLVIDTVASGLACGDWLGFLYVVAHGTAAAFRPRYIGIAGRYGKNGGISANLHNIERNPNIFARWGYGRYHHIGNLSEALFTPTVNGSGSTKYAQWVKKYVDWVDDLFAAATPPTLHEPVLFYVSSWHRQDSGPDGQLCSLSALEEHLIEEIGAASPRPLLNKQHNPRAYEKRPLCNSYTSSASTLAAATMVTR